MGTSSDSVLSGSATSPPKKRWIHAGEVNLTLTWWFKRWPCEETVETPFLKLTCLHLKMDGWNSRFLLGPGLFSGVMLLSVSVDSIDMCLKQTPYAAERIYAGFTPLIPWLVFPLLLVTAPWESRWFVGVQSSTGKDLQFSLPRGGLKDWRAYHPGRILDTWIPAGMSLVLCKWIIHYI